MKKAIIFGSNSTLYKKAKKKLKNSFFLIEYDKNKINFSYSSSKIKIQKALNKENPDYILNFASILGSNMLDYEKVFDINFSPNWEVIKYYLKNKTNKKVKILLIGSSSYKKGKGNYMLYTSSKAALHNLYQAANEKFKKTNINIDIYHPPRFKSKLVKDLRNKGSFVKIDLIVRDLIKKFNEI